MYDAQLLRDCAVAYEALPVFDATSVASYAAFVREVKHQFDELPVRVEWTADNPYADSAAMFADIEACGRLRVYTGGEDHPVLTREQNAHFRAVHDYYGHYLGRNSFGPKGEDGAWHRHAAMFSLAALPAMSTETRGQSAWFFFGPFAQLPPRERPYAIQKAALLPQRFYQLN